MPKLEKTSAADDAALIESNRAFHQPGLNQQNPFLRGTPVVRPQSVEDLSPHDRALMEANRKRHEASINHARLNAEHLAKLQSAPDPVLSSDPRGDLRKALVLKHECSLKLKKARLAEDRGASLLSRQAERLSDLRDVGKRETAKRMAEIAAWAKSGKAGDLEPASPSKSDDELRAAEASVSASKEAAAALAAEREAAQHEHTQAEALAKHAALVCLYQEAGRIGEHLARLREQQIGLAHSLSALAKEFLGFQKVQLQGPAYIPLKLPPRAMAELQFVLASPAYEGQARYDRWVAPMISADGWRAFFDQLLLDSEAKLPERQVGPRNDR